MTFQVWVAMVPVAVLAFAGFFHLSNWTLYVMTIKNVKVMVIYVLLSVTLAVHFPPFTLLILEDTADADADSGNTTTTRTMDESHWHVDILCAASLGVVQGMSFVEMDRSAFGFESVQQLLVWRLCARIKTNLLTATQAALKHTIWFVVLFYTVVHGAGLDYFIDTAADYEDGSTDRMALLLRKLMLSWDLFMCGCVTCFCFEFARDCVEVYATQLPSAWLDEASNEQVRLFAPCFACHAIGTADRACAQVA